MYIAIHGYFAADITSNPMHDLKHKIKCKMQVQRALVEVTDLSSTFVQDSSSLIVLLYQINFSKYFMFAMTMTLLYMYVQYI